MTEGIPREETVTSETELCPVKQELIKPKDRVSTASNAELIAEFGKRFLDWSTPFVIDSFVTLLKAAFAFNALCIIIFLFSSFFCIIFRI